MNNVDEAFDFIIQVFVQITPRDLYLIEREYDLDDDEHNQLMDKLAEAGWYFEENGTLNK